MAAPMSGGHARCNLVPRIVTFYDTCESSTQGETMNTTNRLLAALRVPLRSAALVLATLLWGALQPAHAQQAPAATTSTSGLEEIIVTAQKRAQNSQDVGIALSAVTGEDLARLGAVSASDITKAM